MCVCVLNYQSHPYQQNDQLSRVFFYSFYVLCLVEYSLWYCEPGLQLYLFHITLFIVYKPHPSATLINQLQRALTTNAVTGRDSPASYRISKRYMYLVCVLTLHTFSFSRVPKREYLTSSTNLVIYKWRFHQIHFKLVAKIIWRCTSR